MVENLGDAALTPEHIWMATIGAPTEAWRELIAFARIGVAVKEAWNRYDIPNNRFTPDAINAFVADCKDALKE